MRIEKIINEKGREQFYNYYLCLGYDHKTAAALALFTYGNYRFKKFSIDDLYDSLCKGEEYLPLHVIEERKQMEKLSKSRRNRHTVYSKNVAGGLSQLGGSSYSANGIIVDGLDAEERLCDALFDSDETLADSALEFLYSAEPIETAKTMKSLSVSFTGAMGLAGALGYATDEYEQIEEKDARSTVAEQTSTFRMSTNTASAGVILNQLRNGRRIDRSMVRIEEMLNYFRYNSTVPEDRMFSISSELMDAGDDKKYLYINVQGREEIKDKQNIIILLDVSGSMSGNTEQTQAMIATIISKLGNGDKLSIITYSDDDIIELESFTVNGYEDRIRALEKLMSIKITGCTFGSKGIESAYKIGKKNFIEGGNNQVILITDGDLNFGITDKGGLE